MDPVSALSLVANIFGVITFAKDVVAVASQIRERGDGEQLLRLENAAKTLQSGVADLSGLDGAPSEEDEALSQIAQDITQTSKRINQLLDDVRGGKGRSWPSKLQTTLKVIRTIWNRDTTDILTRELSDAQQRLHLYATLSIKTKLDKHGIRLEEAVANLDRRTADLLPSFLTNFSELGEKCDHILESQSRSEDLATSRHIEIMASLDVIRTKSPCSGDVGKRPSDDLTSKIEETILMSLWSPFLRDREDTIQEAHKKTFDWIFRDPSEAEKPWGDFSAFLRDGHSETYWVSGKPGSGKSTLMKYLSHHQTTRELLLQWAGQNELVMASFYFSHEGSELQTSEAGALRSLLYQILDKNRRLIQLAFTERHRALRIAAEDQQSFEPTVTELRRALKAIIEQCPKISFFLLVDGLDEHKAAEADMGALAASLRNLGGRPNVKTLLSSRPWNVFEENFAGCPHLRLHDLTRSDIEHFVQSKIDEHPRVLREAGKVIPGLDNLKQEIVLASCGVFLWVRLAIRSVLQGLTNHDTIEDLRAWIQQLPSDLEELYRRIWESIPEHYRTQAARLLLLTETATRDTHRLSLVSLSFAEVEDPGYAFSAPVLPLEADDMKDRIERMRARVSSRCLGLLEVRIWDSETQAEAYYAGHCDPEGERTDGEGHILPGWGNVGKMMGYTACLDGYPNRYEEQHGHPHVEFLHRTVNEFILSGDTRQSIIAAAAGPGDEFQVETRLLHASLMRLKTFRDPERRCTHLIRDNLKFPVHLEGFVHRVLLHARRFETATKRPATQAILELDRVMRHFRHALLGPSFPKHLHWSAALYVFSLNEKEVLPLEGDANSLLPLCVYFDLVLFVREHIARVGTECVAQVMGESLLGLAYRAHTGPYVHLPMIWLLLESGATPNDRMGDLTVWHSFLRAAPKRDSRDPDMVGLLLLEKFLLHGTDLGGTILDGMATTGLQEARGVCDMYRKRLMMHPRTADLDRLDKVDRLLDRLEAENKAREHEVQEALLTPSGQDNDAEGQQSEEQRKARENSDKEQQRGNSPGLRPQISTEPRGEEDSLERRRLNRQGSTTTEASIRGLDGTVPLHSEQASGRIGSVKGSEIVQTLEQITRGQVDVDEEKGPSERAAKVSTRFSTVRSLVCCLALGKRER